MAKDLGAVCFFLKSHKPHVYNRRTVVIEGNAESRGHATAKLIATMLPWKDD